MPPPYFLEPELRTLLVQLADAAEQRLGLSETQIAIVVHQRAGPDSNPVYEIAIGCDVAPALLREIRSAFPRRGRGDLRVSMGRLGGLDLINLRADDLRAALVRYLAA